jgi:AraC family transcriptional activator of tynA and feaB
LTAIAAHPIGYRKNNEGGRDVESTGFTTQPSRTRAANAGAHGSVLFERADLAAELARSDAQMQHGEVGLLRYARLTCRSKPLDLVPMADASDAPCGYTLILQLDGCGTLSQYGQCAQLGGGDLALCDNGAPHRHHLEAGSSLLLLRLPDKALRLHLPSPDQFCARQLPASAGMASVAASLVRNVCIHSHGRLPVTAQECLSRQLLEAVALAFTLAFGQLIGSSAVVGGRYARARLFIEQHLSDPDLGPHSIASALKVSARYLRMIFAREGECISAYVLRRRLEETARQLGDPRWRGRSICEIAFNWGFNSAPHFSRSFRGHFGLSPREYRAREAGLAVCAAVDPLTGTG